MSKTGCLCENRAFALVWRLTTLTAGGFGLYTMIFMGGFDSGVLRYFTIQSNIFTALLFAALTAGTVADLVGHGVAGVPFCLPSWLQSGIIFYVQITFAVYALLLSGTSFTMGDGLMTAGNIMLHYAAPLMALADWLLFIPHGRLGVRQAALWLIYPAAYVAFCFIYAGLGGSYQGGARFPYFFMDADIQGLNLLWICPLFFAVFFAAACLMTGADKLLAKRKEE